MLKHLNGWQRLWILLTVLYLVPVAIFTTDAMPKASDYSQTRLYDSLDVAGRQLESITPEYTYEGGYTLRQKYSDLTDEQLIERIHTKFKDKADFSHIESEYRHKMEDLTSEQFKVVGYALLWWIVPSALLYVLGGAVGWVIRGFRHERP